MKWCSDVKTGIMLKIVSKSIILAASFVCSCAVCLSADIDKTHDLESSPITGGGALYLWASQDGTSRRGFEGSIESFQSQSQFAEESDPWSWQLLPSGLMYKSYIAGEKEPRLSNYLLSESGGQTLWDTVLGWRTGLLRFGTARSVEPEGFQLDVEGGTFLRTLPSQGNDLQSVDFRAGIPLTWREGPFQAKFGAYHIESHAGDDFLRQNPGYITNEYSRNAFVFGLGYFVVDSLRLYNELSWSFSGSGGDQPWEWQGGFEWSPLEPTWRRGSPYFAANVHLREATHGSGSLNILAGWQWRRRGTEHYLRAGLQYFTGKNSQYSFLQDNQQLVGLGVRYDY